jgi:sulfonate transport system permease protein
VPNLSRYAQADHLRFVAKPLLLPLLLLLLWQYCAQQSTGHAYAFVPLEQIYQAFLSLCRSGELAYNTWGSLKKALLGLMIGISSGVVLGAILACSKLMNAVVAPIFDAIRQVPLLGLTPLIALWLGNGESAKVFIIALASFYPLTINTYQGLKHTNQQFHELAQIYQLSFWREFSSIRLPQTLAYILTALHLAIPFTWMTTIASELLLNAGSGLGNLMMKAEMNAEMDILLVCAICTSLLAMLMNYAIKLLADHVLRWRDANQLARH